MNLITGHNLIQPKAIDAPLEFTFGAGDAELLARCDAAVNSIRKQHEKDALTKELEAAGFQFVERAA
jgi:hypothetical protein